MGNFRLKLSDMMFSSWFCKLMDVVISSGSDGSNSKMKKTEEHQMENGIPHRFHLHSAPPGTFCHSRRNDNPSTSGSRSDLQYFSAESPPRRLTRHQRTNPRKSSRRKKKPSRVIISSVSAGCNCRATFDSVCAKTEPICPHETELSFSPSPASSAEEPPQRSQSFDQMVWQSTSRSCGANNIFNDAVIGSQETYLEPHIELPSTKPLKFSDMVNNVQRPVVRRREPKKFSLNSPTTSARTSGSLKGFPVNSSAVRLLINSDTPRVIGQRKMTTKAGSHSRKMGLPAKSMQDSFAVVKSSADPGREFRESMVEMIVENNMRASNDLEELLACYLSLNSEEYHDVIISVFKQIWLELSYFIRLK
ncbi:hypothetical protein SAY87_022527 [Trapa incisa]|uniref:Transcription repressor n=1 Tax=Trapa incisa TaxID=236973 RepID=A0AAN7K780_9MYRT|nr:hypothetical protein SAY87_022527 [Trapa incisa]